MSTSLGEEWMGRPGSWLPGGLARQLPSPDQVPMALDLAKTEKFRFIINLNSGFPFIIWVTLEKPFDVLSFFCYKIKINIVQ